VKIPGFASNTGNARLLTRILFSLLPLPPYGSTSHEFLQFFRVAGALHRNL
jgi:hypothetical protein